MRIYNGFNNSLFIIFLSLIVCVLSKEIERNRQKKVIHFLPVPVDGECLTDDRKSLGACVNAYECRIKGGLAKGECAKGFGVCCVFTVTCQNTMAVIDKNITYFISPEFPSFSQKPIKSCQIKIKLINNNISQLRIDFLNFAIGQPNRVTGICDGDAFIITGGSNGMFNICGQNSGQHIYYDLPSNFAPRQSVYGSLKPLSTKEWYKQNNITLENTGNSDIQITMHFTERFLPHRLWEIRIIQIPFSQRAPAGCLQYHTNSNGLIQTFNFAENGRHLAYQNYRICMRQEKGMCSILYKPCDENSFRIGPIRPNNIFQNQYTDSNLSNMMQNGSMIQQSLTSLSPINLASPNNTSMNSPTPSALGVTNFMNGGNITSVTSSQPNLISSTTLASSQQTLGNMLSTSSRRVSPSSISTPTTPNTPNTPNTPRITQEMTTSSSATSSSTTTSSATLGSSTTSSSNETMSTSTQNIENIDEEGSGSNEFNVTPTSTPSRFNFLEMLKNSFNYQGRKHHMRQLINLCNDRITMPCIIEDFIGMSFFKLPNCEPVHCGNTFCTTGITPCQIESTVTPFYISIHFGEGNNKGNPEDNIGACLNFNQVQCS